MRTVDIVIYRDYITAESAAQGDIDRTERMGTRICTFRELVELAKGKETSSNLTGRLWLVDKDVTQDQNTGEFWYDTYNLLVPWNPKHARRWKRAIQIAKGACRG